MKHNTHRLYLLYPLRNGSALRRVQDAGVEMMHPVSTIRGYCQILLQGTQEDDILNAEHHVLLHTILQRAQELGETIASLKRITEQDAARSITTLYTEIQACATHIVRLAHDLEDTRSLMHHPYQPLQHIQSAGEHIWQTAEYLLRNHVDLPSHMEGWLVQRHHVRTQALQGDPSALAMLYEAGQNAEPLIRAEAARLMQHFSQPEVRRILRRLQKDPDETVQFEATMALKAISRRRRKESRG